VFIGENGFVEIVECRSKDIGKDEESLNLPPFQVSSLANTHFA
jgi:hypothetical protein